MLYHVLPRIGVELDPRVLGYRFTYCLENTGSRLRVYLETETPREALSRFLHVEEYDASLLHRELGSRLYVSEARLRSKRDFWLHDTVIRGLPDLASSLKAPGLMCLGFSRSRVLESIYYSRARSLLKHAGRRDPALRAEAGAIVERAGRGVWSIRVLCAAGSRRVLEECEEKLSNASPTALKWVKGVVEDPGGLAERLKPLEPGILARLAPWGIPVACGSTVYNMVELPDPGVHPVGFTRGSPLPDAVPVRSEGDSFRIGVTESGREVRLGIRDLERHVYVVGQTGSGKTSFLKLLVHRLHGLGGAAIIVVDPHGDMSRELAGEIPGAVFLDPVDAPYGVNPLDLPRHRDREYAVSVAIDILLTVFQEVLKLMSTAVNVRYLLRVILRALYAESDSPTMADVYEAILGLYSGRLVLGDPGDPEWRRQLEVLRSMQRQTLISALSRLEPYARDGFLRRLTSRTTIDVGGMLSPGSLTLFSTPKAVLGEDLARLVASTVVLKIWSEVLARARLGEPRTHVFLVIDEFQFVADLPVVDTMLSEARKYGLHLVIAHQHTGQLPGSLLQSILTNTGVKLVFQVAGGDVEKLSMVDADFSKHLSKALTSLAAGTAVLKLSAGPGEQPPPPIMVRLDKPS